MDATTLIFALLVGVVVLASGILTDWERYAGRQGNLPLWLFLARRGVGRHELAADIGEAGVAAAAANCAHCGSKAACRARLRIGLGFPGGVCPNAALLQESSASTPG